MKSISKDYVLSLDDKRDLKDYEYLIRIYDLLGKNPITKKELSKQLGRIEPIDAVPEPTLNKYMNKKNPVKMPIDYIIRFAKYFGVSTDYLLGLSTTKTPDVKTAEICKTTGLTEEAVFTLKQLKNMGRSLLISEFVSDPKFSEALYRIQQAVDIFETGDHHYSVLSTSEIDMLQRGENVEMTEMSNMHMTEMYISIASDKVSHVINEMVYSKGRKAN